MTIPLQITTLLFDLDGTLTVQHPSSNDVLFSILDQHQVPLLASAYRDTQQFVYRYWGNSEEVSRDLEIFGEFTDQFWLYYLERKLVAAGLTREKAAELAPVIQPIIVSRDQPDKIVLEDVRPTLKALRAQGYAMGLVTNRSSSIEEEIETLGFAPFFDFYFTAGEINSWKPDPAIFEHALYLSESRPEETAYIGDNYYTDVLGAVNAGLYPILYDPRNIFPDAECQVIIRISQLCSHF